MRTDYPVLPLARRLRAAVAGHANEGIAHSGMGHSRFLHIEQTGPRRSGRRRRWAAAGSGSGTGVHAGDSVPSDAEFRALLTFSAEQLLQTPNHRAL